MGNREEEPFSWAYAGVNFSLAGNGGPECAALVPGAQKLAETVFVVALNSFLLWLSYPRLTLPDQLPLTTGNSGDVGRRILLLVMCLTFGIELGFKFASRQVIWVLNPCHLVTMVQIFLLAAPPSYFVMALFRLHIHWLGGATIALVFPVLNTRLLPFEVQVYFLQHIMMLVIPLFLTQLGGAYKLEPVSDFSWSTASSALFFIYHFLPLQLVAVLLQVNLNSMLCPAISDPFYGRWYRAYAIVHQTLYVFLHGKLYTYLAHCVARHKTSRSVRVNGFSRND